MKSCWRAPQRSGAPASPLKRRTIPSSTVAPFCWTRRSSKMRGWLRAAHYWGSRNWRGKSSRVKDSHPRIRVSAKERRKSGNALHLDGRAIGEHLGDALHHFGGVVAHSDNGVGAMFAGVLQQQFECIFARLLAEIRENGDVPADDGLQSRAEIP